MGNKGDLEWRGKTKIIKKLATYIENFEDLIYLSFLFLKKKYVKSFE